MDLGKSGSTITLRLLGSPYRANWLMPCFQEKPLSFSSREAVPETNTGGRGEKPKALERTRVKELGKMAP